MDRQDYQRVREVFHIACELEPQARAGYLDEACAGRPDLRRDVDSLFAVERAGGAGALDEPAAGAVVLRSWLATQGDDTLSSWPEAARTIGRYRLLRRIGEGGFGIVFLAEQTEPVVRRVALKIIKAGMDTRQVIARFAAERQALAMMEHPNIARVLDAGATEPGRPFFVMELVDGVPLTEYCDRERLSLRQRLGLFRTTCAAVQHAHQKGIIHRDLKPTNVLVTVADGVAVPKVIDFGIAKATAGPLTDRTLLTARHEMVGTPQYMSPEQAEPGGVDIDTRSDIYSLGILLYELLVGSTPLAGNRLRAVSLLEMQRLIREEEPPPPSQRLAQCAAGGDGAVAQGRPSAAQIAASRRTDLRGLSRELRGDLDWIVMKCLEKDRDRRFATAGALAEDIGRHLEQQPVLAGPPSNSYRLRKFARRNRGAVVAAMAIGATLVIAALVSLRFGLSEARQRAQADRALSRAQRAEREAQARADELDGVVRFQAAQFSGIDAEAMGARLRVELIANARAVAARSLDADQVDARIGDLERILAGNDFTGLALKALNDSFLQPALTAVATQFDDQPLVAARLLQTLASTMQELGLLDAALDPQRRALDLRRRGLGDEHIDTLASIHALGVLLWHQRQLDEAEPYLREALDAYRRVLGEDHPSTVVCLASVGLLLSTRGDLTAAEPLYREVLARQRRIAGADHRETLVSLNNLGTLLVAAGRLDEAEDCFVEVLESYRRVLGEEHPDTLMAIANLGGLRQAQGRLIEAEPYLREALEKRRRVLGEEHPDTLMSLNLLGFQLHTQGQLEQAEPFYREALATRRRLLGDDHPRTLNSINNLAGLLKDQGRLAEAEPLYREALAARRRVLGEEHRDTLGSLSNMGWLLLGQERPSEAEALFREALAKQRRVLGDEHPDTLNSIGNLSGALLQQGRPAEAVALLAAAQPAMRRAFTGANSVRLGRCLTSLGRARVATGEFAAAEADLQDAVLILQQAETATDEHRRAALSGLVELYDAWQVAQPDRGHALAASTWRERLAAMQARSTP